MKIALCQINTKVADFEGNFAKVSRALSWAKKKGASLAVFPELVTFGYPPRDLLDKPYLVQKNIRVAERIAKLTTKNLACIFGFVSCNESKTGKGLFNAAAFAHDGKLCYQQPKTLLPTYDVFDEGRHFDPASKHEPHSFNGVSWGLTVCEDIWSSFDFDGKMHYAFDPIEILKKKGARIIVNISASPFSVGKRDVRRRLLSKKAIECGLPIVYCNMVGGNDELVFDGQSMVVNGQGKIVFEAKRFEEELSLIDLEKMIPSKKIASPPDIEDIHDALVLGLKDYAQKCRFTKAVIGLSGGIDSSVVACLAVEALGAKNVLGLSLPSPYSSVASRRDAKTVARNLKMDFKEIPINNIYSDYLENLHIDTQKKVPLAAENIQARIRGNILMAISNQTDALVLSTGNKSELACGYCTLYGDLAGGLALLSDVPKTLVYKLAHFLNRKKKYIPEVIFKKSPSAELKPDQKDADALPPYDILDPILKAYIEDHRSADQIVASGFKRKMVEEVIWRVDHNEYKRRQSPPGIKVTSKAFGIGRRFPIAWEFPR
ncbi:MAG: NAD+ synthase [Deltaproteobacteria bacterium]|nr:NAD+ synthase [Deltaproteobacteria bacterium]